MALSEEDKAIIGEMILTEINHIFGDIKNRELYEKIFHRLDDAQAKVMEIQNPELAKQRVKLPPPVF
jgi:predicted transcriptional regulator YheO